MANRRPKFLRWSWITFFSGALLMAAMLLVQPATASPVFVALGIIMLGLVWARDGTRDLRIPLWDRAVQIVALVICIAVFWWFVIPHVR